ncbi:hypothetical protein JYG45_23765, partial [Escherichia fergusonii]|uniref:hypothetical protein n=1 Tax=Escherichia fergusonii TaxID=564 RepID=UPI001CBAC157
HLKEEAAECFRTALLMGVGDDELHLRGMLAYAERENVRWDQAQIEIDRIRELLDSLPDDAARLAAPFAHLPLESDPARQLKIARLYA